jgi:hypothetical protein
MSCLLSSSIPSVQFWSSDKFKVGLDAFNVLVLSPNEHFKAGLAIIIVSVTNISSGHHNHAN